MTLNEYLKLQYHIVIHYNKQDGIYYSEVQELKGCWSEGNSMTVLGKTYESMRLWIETALEKGLEIPLPKEE
jgi:predicted RNase H-like HicB family nuclease